MQGSKTFTFSSIYKIGDNLIDSEHEQIFAIASKLHLYKDNDKKIKALIKELLEYTKYHFEHEQEYMQSINYPLTKEHTKLHAQLVAELKIFFNEIATYEYEQVLQKVHYFIGEKIINHILIEDKKIMHFHMDKKSVKENFTFKNSYNLGDYTIDTEHQKIFMIANKALNYSYYPNMKKNMLQTAKELYTYMQEHFEHEQQYMKKIGFPYLEQHTDKHDAIVAKLNTFVKDIPNMQEGEFSKRLIEYIDIYFVSHIIIEDSKIASFAAKKKFSS